MGIIELSALAYRDNYSPMSGKMLGWSSSDLRLLSTKVGDDRSLSLISRTALHKTHTPGEHYLVTRS